ncbi:MAG TPA: OmpH family outer membrane protein [Chitinophagaceae bacterium]|nr:OmpH family outer membrane protein [Chitinophagaceae bacterium]
MKNGLLIWNIVLTLIAGYLLFSHFNSRKRADKPALKPSPKDTSFAAYPPFRIAYFEMDSIESNFQMVKDVQAEINLKEKEYNNDLAKLDYSYKNRYESYQQKAATMSKDDYEKAKIDLKQLEDQLKAQKQELDQEYQDFIMHRQLGLKTTIAEFLKEYNKSRDFSYIIVYERDLFYYKDTAYNITSDVIKGLNEMYKGKKK